LHYGARTLAVDPLDGSAEIQNNIIAKRILGLSDRTVD
jgi:hypothetical protein